MRYSVILNQKWISILQLVPGLFRVPRSPGRHVSDLSCELDSNVAIRILDPFPVTKLSSISTREKFPRTENFPKISLLKVENFQLQNFFPTQNL
jgi:hypothetical protein